MNASSGASPWRAKCDMDTLCAVGEADEDGFEMPSEDFLEEKTLRAWSKKFVEFCMNESERVAPWLMTEAGYDLTLYTGIFQEKIHRQLINTWHLNRGDEYEAFDYWFSPRTPYAKTGLNWCAFKTVRPV